MKAKKKRGKPLSSAMRKNLKLPQKLSLSPQHINKDAWYYEEPNGLHVVAYEAPIPGHARQVLHLTVKWKTLEETMKRYRAYRRALRDGGNP